MKVLFIGADPRTVEMATLSIRLRWPDVTPEVATTAADGLELLERTSPDLVILHPDFSDMSLSEALQALRRFSNIPLLVLGFRGDEMEVVTALELGADDYVRLPCDLTEILGRIWALLRRVGIRTSHENGKPLVSGQLFINPATYEVFLNSSQVMLTTTEFQLLHLLAKNRGTVVTHETMERALWGDHVHSFGLVKKYVQRLRRKLGDDAREPCWIASVHSVGYRFIGPTPGTQDQTKALAFSTR